MDDNDDENIFIAVSSILGSLKEKPIRVQAYLENVVNNYVGRQFQENFRMQRLTFEKLLEIVTLELVPITKPFESIEKGLLATIWILATPDSYR